MDSLIGRCSAYAVLGVTGALALCACRRDPNVAGSRASGPGAVVSSPLTSGASAAASALPSPKHSARPSSSSSGPGTDSSASSTNSSPAQGGTACDPRKGGCPDGLMCLARDPARKPKQGTCVIDLASLPDWRKPELIGATVGFADTRVGGWRSSTKKLCGPGNPCCNYSSGGMAVSASIDELPDAQTLLLVNSKTEPYTCSGTTCSPYTHCTVPVENRYRIIGKLISPSEQQAAELEIARARQTGAVLEVQSIVPLK
jgi:hypothetical protein